VRCSGYAYRAPAGSADRRSAVIVAVIVAVDVIDTVAVAVHVHGNDTVIVIRPVDGR